MKTYENAEKLFFGGTYMKKIFRIIVLICLLCLICLIPLLKNYTNILGKPKYIYVDNYSGKKFEKISDIEYLELIFPTEFSLNKIKYCDNLKELFIISHKKYENLNFIGDTDISSFSYLGECEDWSKIAELTSLNELNIYRSNYSNTEYISRLNQLNSLTIQTRSDLNIENLTSLYDLKYLAIDIPNNDLSGLCDLKQVETLCIWGCENISDLSFLKYMDNVTTLNLQSLNNIKDYDFLLEMKNLRRVEILIQDENIYIDDIIALLESNGVEVVRI
jgi:hypothetical protein